MLEEEIESLDFEDIIFEDTKFSYEEYASLEERMQELKDQVSKLDLVENQIKKIDEKLDYLLKLAQSMKKRDWKELFIGAMLSLIMQLIDKATGQAIFSQIRALFVKFLPPA